MQPGNSSVFSSRLYDAAIIGGGLAGLVTAIALSRAGKKVVLFEKKHYPAHKVCGEYVSHEVLPYLRTIGFDPMALGAADIQQLRITTTGGKGMTAALPLGGFGLSRYAMDAALARLAADSGATVITGARIADAALQPDGTWLLSTQQGDTASARMAAGAWGKRDVLDKKLDRPFIQQHTGFMGVKYHVRGNFSENEISLNLFPGGYCGFSKVEDNTWNLCYLYRRGGMQFSSMDELNERALFQNPALRTIFREASFVRDTPEVINEISFAPKTALAGGILLCGDAAGLITPLCGNGMAMAIRSGKMLSDCMLAAGDVATATAKAALDKAYSRAWQKQFAGRLAWGRAIQAMFYSAPLLHAGMGLLGTSAMLQRWLIRKTHGEVI